MSNAAALLRRAFGGHGLVRAGGAMAGLRGLTIMTGMALSVLLARFLGAEGYGRYLFALTIAQMLAMPVLAGLPTLLTRQVAVYRSQTDWSALRGIIRWSLAFVGLTTGVLALGGLGYSAVIGGVFDPAILVYLLAIPLVISLAFMQVASGVLRGFEFPVRGFLPDTTIRPVLLLGFVGGAVLIGILTPALAMSLHIAASATALAWAVLMVLRHCPTIAPNTAPAAPRFESRAWLGSLLPLSLITAAAMINSRLDLFMLGVLSSEESVAKYGLAMQIGGVVSMAQTILYNIAGPKMARMWAREEKAELQNMIRTVSRLSFTGALVSVIGLALLGNPVIPWLVGEEYQATVVLAIVISLGILFGAAMGPAAHFLNMSGHERYTVKIMVMMALANALMNLILIPLYGPMGAAVASLVSAVLFHTSCVMMVNRILGISTMIAFPAKR